MNRNLSVTLVGPEYPINVGYVARLMKNFGISKLFLVEPKADLRIASIYASHGGDLVRKAEMVGFEEVRRRHELLVATTAIRATRKGNVVRTTMKPEEAVHHIAASRSTSLIFGRDTTGLRNEEIEQCDVVTSLETGTKYRTLNLSHAASIVFYLISRTGPSRPVAPSRGAREMLAKYGYELATGLGVKEQKAKNVRNVIQRIALRSELNEREITTLLSLLRRAAEELKRGGGDHALS